MGKGREALFKELKRHKRNRTPGEVEELLELYGFVMRDASKEGSIWKRGSITLTLPTPKTKELLVVYVGRVLNKIQEAIDRNIPEERSS